MYLWEYLLFKISIYRTYIYTNYEIKLKGNSKIVQKIPLKDLFRVANKFDSESSFYRNSSQY